MECHLDYIQTELMEIQRFKLKPGDSVILYSDGVTEQQNADNKQFWNETIYTMY